MSWFIRKWSAYIVPLFKFLFLNINYIICKKQNDRFVIIPSYSQFGGTRTYFVQLLYLLHKRNAKALVLLNPHQADKDILALLSAYDFHYNIIPNESYLWEHNGQFTYQLLFFFANKILKDLNLVLTNCVGFKASTLIISTGEPEQWLSLFWLPIKRINYILHTLPYRGLGRIGNYTLRKRLGSNRFILTVSKYAKNKIIQDWKINSFSEDHINFIYNCFQPSITPKVKTLNRCHKLRVLTLGTVATYKGPLFWIDVAKQVIATLPNLDVEFVWAGDGNLLEECQSLTKNISKINFIGYCSEVDDLYLNSNIYFQPSVLESHGIAAVGAMYYSLPCVVSNVGGLPESVQNHINGFAYELGDSTRAINAICELLTNQSLAKKFGLQSKNFFHEKFTFDIWSQNITPFLFI